MCLAVPSKIVEKDQFTAVVDTYGARRQVSLMLLPEEVQVGDYVLVHAGFAIQKVQPQAAQEALGLIEELLERLEEEEPQG